MKPLRLSPIEEAKPFLRDELALCMAKLLSNSRGNGTRQFASEERGGVKIHHLSPRMHFASGDGDTKGVRGRRRGASTARRRNAGGRQARRRSASRSAAAADPKLLLLPPPQRAGARARAQSMAACAGLLCHGRRGRRPRAGAGEGPRREKGTAARACSAVGEGEKGRDAGWRRPIVWYLLSHNL